ncbi:hypothetical protein MMC16_003222 [Acarospora aff. strigata]|nr:hypothetical protein [Acarospora aff. strigata]
MRFSTLFANAAFLLALVSAKCYKNGPNEPNKQLALDNIATVCKTMQGNFRSGLERTACVTNSATGNQWFFGIKCRPKTDRLLTFELCMMGLRREVDNCKHGGSLADGDWQYTSDANAGVCMDVKYINAHPRHRKRAIDTVSGTAGPITDEKDKKDVTITFGSVPPQPAQ